MVESFARKMLHFLSTGRDRIKTCGLSYETPLLFSSSSPFLGKRCTLLPNPTIRRFFLRSFVRADGHAPAHRALSEFAIPAFTLHLHTYSIDTQTLACEHHPYFLLHRGEGKGGEAFTRKLLFMNFLQSSGEEVKAKNEKRRTRA